MLTALKMPWVGELLIFENGSYGMAQNLESTDVGIIILGDFTDIREGDTIRRTGKIMEVLLVRALLDVLWIRLGRQLTVLEKSILISLVQ